MTPMVPLQRMSATDKLHDCIKYEATTGINREQALRLHQIVYDDMPDGHNCMGWDRLRRLIHEAGYSTIVFPLANGNSYNRNTKNFSMYWGMVDRGSATYGVQQGILCDEDRKQQTFNLYCYGTLRPVQDYVRDWMQMNLESVGYVVNTGSIQDLLAKQTKWSDKSGHGSSAVENWHFWNEDFQNEWPEGTDRVLRPEQKLPIKRLKFRYVALQPETERYRVAWEIDNEKNNGEDS